MIRRKKQKVKKIRTCISIDEDILEEIGLYVDNLSAYINKCLKLKLESEKAKEQKKEDTGERIIKVMSTNTPSVEELQKMMEGL